MEANGGFVKRLSVGDSLVIPAYVPPKKPKFIVQDKTSAAKSATKQVKDDKKDSRSAPAKGNVYVVKPGDNLYGISLKYNCTVDGLKAWNKLKGDGIFPGDTLIVRGKPTAKQTSADTKSEAAPPKGFVFYTVKQGDSLFDIAKSYKTTIDSIVKWNGLSGTKIKAGDRLKIKKP